MDGWPEGYAIRARSWSNSAPAWSPATCLAAVADSAELLLRLLARYLDTGTAAPSL